MLLLELIYVKLREAQRGGLWYYEIVEKIDGRWTVTHQELKRRRDPEQVQTLRADAQQREMEWRAAVNAVVAV